MNEIQLYRVQWKVLERFLFTRCNALVNKSGKTTAHNTQLMAMIKYFNFKLIKSRTKNNFINLSILATFLAFTESFS